MPAKPYAAPAVPGLVVRQNPVNPASQFLQNPQATLKGRQTQSPTLIRSTASPTSTTWPRFSWPRTSPSSMSVRPSYMCRSEPQMLLLVILTSTSVGRSIFASVTFLTRKSRGPLSTNAFIRLSPHLILKRTLCGARLRFGLCFGDSLALLALEETLGALLRAAALAGEAAPQRLHHCL